MPSDFKVPNMKENKVNIQPILQMIKNQIKFKETKEIPFQEETPRTAFMRQKKQESNNTPDFKRGKEKVVDHN